MCMFYISFQPIQNNGQISELNGKPDGTIADVNGHCEDQIPEEGW